MNALILANTMLFLSTLSLRRATNVSNFTRKAKPYFYPRSPCGERRSKRSDHLLPTNFYPRSPCGERLSCAWSASKLGDFYPRSPCGERQYLVRGQRPSWGISIHALLAESDACITIITICTALFLSTLSLRRATREPTALRTPHHIFLSTLSLRRATTPMTLRHCTTYLFLSTLSLRRATLFFIGLHLFNSNFYPRSPCGERRLWACPAGSACLFLSTLSLRRATS